MRKIKTKGNKRKPRGRPFKPGQSGNPGGRPRVLTEFRLAAREYSTQALEILRSIMCGKRASASARVQAARELLNRAWGLPQQELVIEGVMAHVAAPAPSWNQLTRQQKIDCGRRLIFLLNRAAHDTNEEARA